MYLISVETRLCNHKIVSRFKIAHRTRASPSMTLLLTIIIWATMRTIHFHIAAHASTTCEANALAKCVGMHVGMRHLTDRYVRMNKRP